MRHRNTPWDGLRLTWTSRLLLLFVAAVCVTLLTMLWRKLDGAEDQRLRDAARITSAQVARRLEAWFGQRAMRLEGVVDVHELDAEGVPVGFERRAERLLARLGGCAEINWVDADRVIQSEVPGGSGRTFYDKALHRGQTPVVEALDAAEAGQEPVRTPIRPCDDDALDDEGVFEDGRIDVFLAFRKGDGRLLGFVHGVFDVKRMVEDCLAEPALGANFRWRIREDDGTVAYAHERSEPEKGPEQAADGAAESEPHADGLREAEWPHTSPEQATVVGRAWHVELAPSPGFIARVHTIADEIAFVAGLLITLLLIILLRGTLLSRDSLRRSEAMYRSLVTDVVDASRVGILILDRWHRIVWMNASLGQYFGIRPKNVVGEDMRRVFRDVLDSGAIPNAPSFVHRLFPSANAVVGPYECHVRAGRGRDDRWLEHRSQPIREGLFAGGRIDHFYDITPRKRADVERSRLIAAIEQGNEAVVITDPQGYTQYVNAAFERASGYERLEVVGRRTGIPVQGPHEPSFYEEIWHTLNDGRTWQGRMKSVRRDGTEYEEVATISPIRDPSGRIVNFVAVKRDVTKESELEAQLRQSQKMEAVGKLAGGVAHDFNNLLQVILGRSQILLARTGDDGPQRESLKGIVDASERAAGLTKQLLAFGRQQLLEKRVLDPNRLVSEHVKMLRRLIGEDITLSVRLGENVGNVYSDRTQIEQVLMNLCVNARDAMPDGGKIEISTDDVVREHLGPDGEPTDVERFAAILVQDNGVGIPPENIDRVCEPFFSTKEPGRGSGLGLATVYGIVNQHGGQLEIESDVGKGTTFRILLPVTEETADEKEDDAPDTAETGTERILVVEDDPRVRALAVDVLSHAGYRVRTASDGEDALRVLELSAETIDLVFTDMVMPKMGGPELLRQVAERNGGTRVLLTTGYSAESVGSDEGLDVEILTKPYTPRAMLRKIRQVLDN